MAKFRKRYLLPLFISIILTLTVPALLTGPKIFDQLARLPEQFAAGLLLLVLIGWIFNTLRLIYLLRCLGKPVGFVEAALITISTEFAGAATPAASGMPATYMFLLHRLGLKLGRAMGLVAILVLFDVFFFFSAMFTAAVAMLLSRSPLIPRPLLAVVLVGAAGGVLFFWLLSRYFRPIYYWLSRVMAGFPWMARRRYGLARTTVEFLAALRVLKTLSWAERLQLYFLSVGLWLPRYLVLIVAVALVSRQLPVDYLFLLQGLLNVGGQMFILPSGGGGVDAVYTGVMGSYLDQADIAFTLIIWRAFTFYWYLAVGGPIFMAKTGKAARDLLSRSGT